MTNTRLARSWHLITFVTAVFALVFQLWIILARKGFIFDATDATPMLEQVRRFFSYFTIQSNLLVAIGTGMILAGRTDSRWFRAIRLAGLIGIVVTGIVAATALQPPPGFGGVSLVADRLLHIIVPVLALVGWLVFGPRGHARTDALGLAILWPVLWLAATLGLAPLTNWYPYPFLNAGVLGYGRVALNCVMIAALFLALCAGAIRLDRALPNRERVLERA